MDKHNRESEGTAAARDGVGPIRDFRNLQMSGTASLSELREFLGSLKGRKPQEVIGIVSASLLVQSMAIATAATLGVLVVFTVGPYLMYGPPQPHKSATAKAAPAAASAEQVKPAESEKRPADATAKPTVSEPDAAKAAKVMGLDESKTADPKRNPLDSPNLDKLLDGIDK